MGRSVTWKNAEKRHFPEEIVKREMKKMKEKKVLWCGKVKSVCFREREGVNVDPMRWGSDIVAGRPVSSVAPSIARQFGATKSLFTCLSRVCQMLH